jgi:predicted RNA methylase
MINLDININVIKYIEKINQLYLPQRLLDFTTSDERHIVYHEVISKAISSNNNIYTLHTGIGCILSAMLSIAAGAKGAIICEQSKYLASIYNDIIDDNKFSSHISVLNKRVTNIKHKEELNHIPNMLILDCIDSSLLGQGIISIINHIRYFLKISDIQILPEKATLYALTS